MKLDFKVFSCDFSTGNIKIVYFEIRRRLKKAECNLKGKFKDKKYVLACSLL